MELRKNRNLIKKPIIRRQTDFNDKKPITYSRIYVSDEELLSIKKSVTENDNTGILIEPSKHFIDKFEFSKKSSNALTDNKVSNEHQETSVSENLKTNKNSETNKKSIKVTKTNIHKSHRQRLKNQFLENGISSLTDIQKLELLLFFSIPQKDTNPIAHELLDTFKNLKNVLNASTDKLMEVNGIKENSATLIKLVNDLINYSSLPTLYDGTITSVIEAKEFCTNLYKGINVEQFYVICLTKSNKVKDIKMIKSGSADEVNVQIRDITQFALDSKCNRIIISHNHPHDNNSMSDEDCAFTYSVICSCILNSIEIVDHIIVGTSKTYSMASQNVLQKLKERAVNTIQIPRDKMTQLSILSKDYDISDKLSKLN